jgi:M6 family metalloprotease-like protein
MKKSIFLILFLIIFKNNIFAVPAIPTPFVVQQADGTEVTIYLHGDEFFACATTEDGFLATRNSENQWVFAVTNNSEKIVPTSELARAKRFLPNDKVKYFENINQNIDLQKVISRKRAERITLLKQNATQQRSETSFTGTMKALVILVNFTDKQFVVSNPQQAFYDLLNQQNYSANGGTGSAREYFIDNSNGSFSPQFDVFGPFDLSHNMAYYGTDASGIEGNDIRPDAMVREACNLAYASGQVDFTQYDYDHNGIVDQVFIYYAGNNQAEGADANTIWPHRSWLYNCTVGSMRIQDYACASELRSANGTTPNYMCGIGTFVHEFGHILGLPDIYDVEYGSNTHTPENWDIMDTGCYLNNGKTPAGYSSYERFYVGWLTPRVINAPENVTLDPLNTSNTALMVTETGTSNLNGVNPTPKLFYMLENRQKTKWDRYLPGHGLLITKINFNASTWANNMVNTNASNYGVDIMEADESATNTAAGDPFPGSYHVTSYNIAFNSGTKPLTDIAENSEIITFKFMGGITSAAPNIEIDRPKIFIENNNLIVEIQNFENQQINIFNIERKQIYSGNFIHSFKINKNDFAKGIYFVKIGNFVEKFIL